MHCSQAETERRQTGEAAVHSSPDAANGTPRPGVATGSGPEPAPPPSATAATDAEQRQPSKRLRNQFNFNERAVQTVSHPPRDRGTSSEPPPTATASGLHCTKALNPLKQLFSYISYMISYIISFVLEPC